MKAASEKKDKIKISIVITIFNEKESINILYNQIKESIKLFGNGVEIIFVDDGSTDGSSEILKGISERDEAVRIFKFLSNKGQHKAMEAGFKEAEGEIVITMDGDLQNDPRDIPALISKLNEGYDVVCGWRTDRKDPKRIILKSKIANYLQRKITRMNLHDMSCSLRAYRGSIVKGLILKERYDVCLLPYILSKNTKAITEIKIRHNKRIFGKSKYNFFSISAGVIRCYLRLLLRKFTR